MPSKPQILPPQLHQLAYLSNTPDSIQYNVSSDGVDDDTLGFKVDTVFSDIGNSVDHPLEAWVRTTLCGVGIAQHDGWVES